MLATHIPLTRIARITTTNHRIISFRNMLQILPIAICIQLLSSCNHAYCSSAQRPLQPAELEQLCADCRLTSQSVEDLVRRPRQMDSYGQVEARIDLDKIKKTVCRDIIDDYERERCRQFYFTQQSSVLKWKQQQEANNHNKITFFDFVCIRELKYCCPENGFGPKCTKCTKCDSNQHCHGEGTRTGNGTCVCKLGHSGDNCSTCLPGYYSDGGDSRGAALKLASRRPLCKQCHRSCLYCRKEGPLGCEVCQKGYTWLPSFGCSDIDECFATNQQQQRPICQANSFCVNTEGSYYCYECDRACDGCQGDGPDMCTKCAKNYRLDKSGNCVANRKTILPPEANYYRYAIYAGLCICTCIILHNSVYLASLIGLCVAVYIGFSEVTMSGFQQQLLDGQHKNDPTFNAGANIMSSSYNLNT